MPGPIEGIRIVDLSLGHAGPRATGMLADYGADVVWVEPPGGDPYRAREPGAVSVFARSKRSATAKLTEAAGRDSVVALIARADVVVTAWPQGDIPDGLDPASLRVTNPGLVCCSISDAGPVAPDGWPASLPLSGHEALVQAVLGGCDEGQSFREGPIYPGF